MIFIFSQTAQNKVVSLTLNKILIITGVSIVGAVIFGKLLSLLIFKIIKFKGQ